MCKLTKTQNDLDCHFKGTAGDSVTLAAQASKGLIQFASAKYDGRQLVAIAPADTVTFTIKSGQKTLAIVYAFSTGQAGHGHLLENCGGGQTQVLRDDLEGDEPLVFYSVCGGA